MPIDPAIDDGGPTFLWTCTRCTDWGLHLTWVRASLMLHFHREIAHGLYGLEANPGPKQTECIDCGATVTVIRIRAPRCDTCRTNHERALDRARRAAVA